MRLACILGALLFPMLLQGETRVCLTMVVKNEEAVIQRCLNSAIGLVDCLSICDVGSTDNTIALIEAFIRTTGIPGKIHQHEWRDFAHNRTLSVQAAQQSLKESGIDLSQTYLLVLDADMVIHTTPAFKKSSLEALGADTYFLAEQSSALGCYTYASHLLRASRPWINTGMMCDSWDYRGPQQAAKLPLVTIENRSDGGLTKEQTSIEFIEEALNDEPDSTCYTLRLAHLHRCQKHYDDAIYYYKMRIELGGDKEEIWFSKYMIGKCYEEQGQWDQACQWYLKAYQYNSTRTESLLKIATHFRVDGENSIAYLFSKPGFLAGPAQDQMLFDVPPHLDYYFDQEIAISAYYNTHFKKDGYAATSALLLKKDVPWHIRNQAYLNMLHYAPSLKSSRLLPITIELPFVRMGFEERYRPMNPSILKTAEGYELICRSVNYTQKGAVPSNFKTNDPRGIFRTRNFLVRYDRDFNILSQQEIIDSLSRYRPEEIVHGLEDCHLVKFGSHTWFTCTTSNTNPTGNRQISLCQIDPTLERKKIPVKKIVPLKGPDLYRCEKNWLPFVKDDLLYVIYSCDPFIIYKPDLETGDCEKVLHYEPAHDFSGFRGSAAPILFDDGYLMLIHESVQYPDQTRFYLHRFVYMDKDFIIQKVSKPFTFLHLGIEFCLSMTIDHTEKELVMAIGVEDRQAYLFFTNLGTVRSLLDPLPPIQMSIEE